MLLLYSTNCIDSDDYIVVIVVVFDRYCDQHRRRLRCFSYVNAPHRHIITIDRHCSSFVSSRRHRYFSEVLSYDTCIAVVLLQLMPTKTLSDFTQ